MVMDTHSVLVLSGFTHSVCLYVCAPHCSQEQASCHSSILVPHSVTLSTQKGQPCSWVYTCHMGTVPSNAWHSFDLIWQCKHHSGPLHNSTTLLRIPQPMNVIVACCGGKHLNIATLGVAALLNDIHELICPPCKLPSS